MKKKEFKSPSDWFDFSHYIQTDKRYVLNSDQKKFINVLLEKAKGRVKEVPKGEIFYRARIGYIERSRKHRIIKGKYVIPKSKMYNPPYEEAKEGRINPKGISYLYLSKEEKTAIAEVRPWLKQLVTVAECELKENIKIIDTIPKEFTVPCLLWEKNATPEEKEEKIWDGIDFAFSWPVRDGETSTEYAPTQYIAEVFRNANYHGVMYKSSLIRDGVNLALFNSNKVKINKEKLVEIIELAYDYKKYKNT